MLTLEETLGTLEQSSNVPCIDSLIQVLQQCRKTQTATFSKRVHVLIHCHGLETNIAVANYLVPVLVDCRCVHAAQQTFHRLSHHNEHSWTSLIQGFSESKEASYSPLSLLQAMEEESAEATSYTFLALLKICMQWGSAEVGQQLHLKIVEEGFEDGPYVGSALVGMYAKFGTCLEAQDVFDSLLVRDVVLWTSLIKQYVENDFAAEALHCSEIMEEDGVSMDTISCVYILRACGSVEALDKGCEMHAMIAKKGFEGDLFVGNSLIDMYSKCNCLREALQVFDKLPARDVVSWNSLIAAYSELGSGEEVLICLEKMRMEGLLPSGITLVCTFQALSIVKERNLLQMLHSEIVKEGIELDLFVGNGLLDAYSKCGLLAEAQNVFYHLPIKDVISWTSLLDGFSEQGLYKEAFDCLEQMQVEDVYMDAVALVCILKLCSSIGAIETGLKIHALVVMDGLENDPAIGNSLIDLYANGNKLIEAQETFDDLRVQSVVSWNALLAGYAEQGLGDETLECLEKMKSNWVCPNVLTYVSSLQGCGSIGALDSGQGLHVDLTKKGYDTELLVGNALVDLYSKCGSLDDADYVFDELQDQNVVSWVALLSGYVENGFCTEALNGFIQMKSDGMSPNALAYIYLLKACSKLRALDEGQAIHLDVVVDELDTDQLVVITLVNLYAKCGSHIEAQELHDTLPVRNTASWNALLTGFVEYGLYESVLESFAEMESEGVLPDAVTFVCCLKSCRQTSSLSYGQILHVEIVKDCLEVGTSVCNALIDMYAKFGLLQDVEDVFEGMPIKTTITWNALLVCYDGLGLVEKVLSCFEKFHFLGFFPNASTYAYCLRACTKIGAMDKGRQLHVDLICDGHEEYVLVSGSLMDMYAGCGLFEEAQDILYEQPVKETMLWNALLLGYTKHGCSEDVLKIFERMHTGNVCADAVTYMCSLKACTTLGATEKGKELHSMIVQENFESESVVGNSLVDMYAKCGFLLEAQEVFDDLLIQDVISWSALISGYACQGDFRHVSHLLERMREKGIQPDEVLLLRLLSACSHAGLVERGQMYFESAGKEYDMVMTVEHVNCMMDLLSRAGQLDESVAMTERIPCVPDVVTWTTMLGACRKWGNLELGLQAFEGAASLDDYEAASFVLLSNIYAGDTRSKPTRFR
ncbi:hypothetical protein L7F22_050791 [Adiantum nelumboides]|nr:hypothetical protein [Adiantum nelumboides]